MDRNKLEILLTAKDAASKTISSVGDSFGGLSKHAVKFGENAEKGSKMLLASMTAAAVGVAAFGKSSVTAYMMAAEATAKLSTNLLNVKGNSAKTVKELEGLASQLQSVGVIEDDVIKAGMSQLATFNLQGSTIAKLTPKITDMVAQMKGHNATAEDMVGINNLVGKVMTGNVGALSRYGVTLNATQEAQIKNGNEAQRAAAIVEVLGQNYGEVNKALRNTPQGMITALKNDFGDLQEGVGEFIVTAARPLLDVFSRWIARVNDAGGFLKYFEGLIKNNMDTVKRLTGALVAMLIPALVSMGIAAAPIVLTMGAIAAVGAILGPKIDDLAQKFGGWSNILGNVKQAFEIIIDVVRGWDPGATMDEATWKKWDTFATTLWNVRENIVEVAKQVADYLGPKLEALWNTVTQRLAPAIWDLMQTIGPALGVGLVGAIGLAIDMLNGIITFISDNTWVVVALGAAFVAVKTAMFLSGAIQAFTAIMAAVRGQAVLTAGAGGIGGITNSIVIMRGLLLSPLAMPAIAVGAALLALGLVIAKAWETTRVVQEVDANIAKVNRGMDVTNRRLIDMANQGQITLEKLYAIQRSSGSAQTVFKNNNTYVPGFASGVENFGGGLAYVHKGEVLANLPKGTDVIPANQVQKGLGATTNIYGNIVLSDQSAVDRFFDKLNRQDQLVGMGLK